MSVFSGYLPPYPVGFPPPQWGSSFTPLIRHYYRHHYHTHPHSHPQDNSTEEYDGPYSTPRTAYNGGNPGTQPYYGYYYSSYNNPYNRFPYTVPYEVNGRTFITHPQFYGNPVYGAGGKIRLSSLSTFTRQCTLIDLTKRNPYDQEMNL
ncbi:hypothetical protein ABKN59_007592 [Abortiporus biennis]